jgi:hypothetical protein
VIENKNLKVGANSELFFSKIPTLKKRQISIPELVKGKKVLSIGCVDMVKNIPLDDFIKNGMHQMYNLKESTSELIGIDINKEGLNELKSHGFNVEYLDVFSVDETHPICNENFDFIVVSHVIEHIPDLFGFLTAIKNKFKFKNIIIAVPNAYKYKSLLNVVFLKKEVISNDHFHTFSPTTAIKITESIGFSVCNVYFDDDFNGIKLGQKYKLLGLFNSLLRRVVFKSNGDIIIHAKN